ncbi:hypothetical protein P3F56_02990 [cyanobacterium endosymbiont of Epithemia clementina EcSB]|nr:hypothetical protein [cyanobacterium endosymbiont of Epithemia clementina EcSB]WGT68062.1 hypothetical protein P3F56_02990 [cyanobacterium endosymbiont of Epithemia clementina EcSB]
MGIRIIEVKPLNADTPLQLTTNKSEPQVVEQLQSNKKPTR